MQISTRARGLGPQLIREVASALSVDSEWSLSDERKLVWWAGGLAQRMWAAEPVLDLEIELTCFHIETDLLCSVPSTHPTLDLINGHHSRKATLGAPVLDLETGTLRLHTTLWVHEQNFVNCKALAKSAAALQLAEAYRNAERKLHNVIGGRLEATSHPSHGRRQPPDEMVNVVEVAFRPFGEQAEVIVDPEEFRQAEMFFGESFMASSDDLGITVEVPFSGERTSLISLFRRKGRPQTALIRARTNEAHPQLGPGLLTTLHLPLSMDRAAALLKSAQLNWTESRGACVGLPLLGSWCEQGGLLAYVSFCPAMTYRENFLMNLLMNQVQRAKWAQEAVKKAGAWP